MKLPVVLLAASIAANAALVALLVARPSLAPVALRSYLPSSGSVEPAAGSPAAPAVEAGKPGATAKPNSGAKAAAGKAAAASVWSALDTDDLRALVAKLRAAGFSASVIRGIVNAKIEAQFAPRFYELLKPALDLPYWKPDPRTAMINNQEFYEKQNQLYRERTRLMREVLGDEFFAYGGDPAAAQRRQFGDIPKSKIDLIQRINDDYGEMTSQVRAGMQGVTLPEDREKLALLEREKRADLAAVLTPQELEEYELRTSRTASQLRGPLSIMDATEDEFRTLYRILQPSESTLYPTAGGFSPETGRLMTEARKKADEQIAAALGPQRYAEYQRANDRDFQALYGIGQREGVARDAMNNAFSLRTTYAEQSTAIVADKTKSNEEKSAALKTLGQNARIQLTTVLGQTAGSNYAQASRWVRQLESGDGSFTIRDGNIISRPVSMPQPLPRK